MYATFCTIFLARSTQLSPPLSEKTYASMEITFQRDLNFPHHEPSIIIITIEEEKRENGNEYNIQYTRTLYGIDNREQSHNISSVYDYVLYFIII